MQNACFEAQKPGFLANPEEGNSEDPNALHPEDGGGRNLKQRGGGSVAVLVISGLFVAVGVVSLSLCQVGW